MEIRLLECELQKSIIPYRKKIHIDSALPDERHSYQSDHVIWFDHATIEKITFQMIGPTCSSQLLYSYCFSDVCFNFYFVLSIFWLP